MDIAAHGHQRAARVPPVEVADIVRTFQKAFLQQHVVTSQQYSVLHNIINCRTAVLGGHVDVCQDCNKQTVSYNSCRNRHCPKCQSIAGMKWVEGRQQRVLPTAAFHVVFTLPKQLRPLAYVNQDLIYNLLFSCVSACLLELGDNPRWLGARLGVTAVLHTWTRELLYHPHIHCVVTAGGLSPDGSRWIATPPRFLMPTDVLAALFKGKFIDGLRQLRRQGRLKFEGRSAQLADPAIFAQFCNKLSQIKWVAYSKQSFEGPEYIFKYLGRYTHRTGISNHRLVAINDHNVTFRTHGDATVTIPGPEFLRRFLQHVLPRNFVKIRHYGLMAPSNVNTALETARRLIRQSQPNPDPTPTPPVDLTLPDLLLELTREDIRRCRDCGGQIIRCEVPRGTTFIIARDTS